MRTVYELSDSKFEALQALGAFADNAFAGYGKGHGGEEEAEMAVSFAYLVKSFVDLLEKTVEKKEVPIG